MGFSECQRMITHGFLCFAGWRMRFTKNASQCKPFCCGRRRKTNDPAEGDLVTLPQEEQLLKFKRPRLPLIGEARKPLLWVLNMGSACGESYRRPMHPNPTSIRNWKGFVSRSLPTRQLARASLSSPSRQIRPALFSAGFWT